MRGLWLTIWILELLSPLKAADSACSGARVVEVLFGTWQWCFLDWQRMFGQWALVCIVFVWLELFWQLVWKTFGCSCLWVKEFRNNGWVAGETACKGTDNHWWWEWDWAWWYYGQAGLHNYSLKFPKLARMEPIKRRPSLEDLWVWAALKWMQAVTPIPPSFTKQEEPRRTVLRGKAHKHRAHEWQERSWQRARRCEAGRCLKSWWPMCWASCESLFPQAGTQKCLETYLLRKGFDCFLCNCCKWQVP